ncbi:hypothetical protein CN233_21530 [Sinorhizobium meliloti]|nr:hypothetical protein EBB04_06930 [Sinorhizobium meliloti]RVG13427.1 hypothetical protein CN231_19810 [Sinorhizobium meliloti]RVG27876.1 hypothetical protein CN233_21530 [Sinorhizobium meliloti]RVI64697.1 hypothetical protein CN189_13280 [Sinorhizobium meliloti]RVK94183.1 hypothetical protein CN152_22195 [Sinorhizobium meliloti]
MPLIPLPRPSPRCDGAKGQAAGWPFPLERPRSGASPRVPFAPLAGRRWPAGRMRGRCRQPIPACDSRRSSFPER